MSTSLFFNLSFDLGGISLILFVVWFFVNFNNSEAAFKWFSLSILALLASVIILSYGATKLSRMRSSLPTQNETEIMNLKQEVATLKEKESSTSHQKSKAKKDPVHHKAKPKKTKRAKTKKAHSVADEIKLPHRIVTGHGNDLVKEAVAKHPRHIYLIGKVDNANGQIIVRGVHSNQHYLIKGHHHKFVTNEFVIIKGTATHGEANLINVDATSGKYQPDSPKPAGL